MKFLFLLLALIWISSNSLLAQKGVETNTKYGSGADSINCLKFLMIYDLDFKQKKYVEAYDAWLIAFNECPLSTLNLYTHGAKIVGAKYEGEKEATQKEAFYQLLLKVYDQRAKYFGNSTKYPTSYIMGLKALDMLSYKGGDLHTQKEAYTYLLDNITNCPQTAQPAIISSFMTVSVSLYKSKELAAEQFISNYSLASSLIDQNITAEVKPERITSLKTIKLNMDALFVGSGVADCKTLEVLFSADFDKMSGDLVWLKNCTSILIKQNCQESDVFFKIAAAQYSIAPSADAAYGLAIMNLKRKELTGATEYLLKAIEYEQDPLIKAKYQYQLGLVYYSQSNFVGAKARALQSLGLNPSCGECYIMLGKIYAQSAKTVSPNEFEQKSAYWAAVDKFIKAKSVDESLASDVNQFIATYSPLFPTKEELFFQGISVGSSYEVGGIINERTTVRARK